MHHLTGVIIGSGWQSAPNVSEEFRKIAIGSLSYEDLPEVSDYNDVYLSKKCSRYLCS